jgi:hypothetical protein
LNIGEATKAMFFVCVAGDLNIEQCSNIVCNHDCYYFALDEIFVVAPKLKNVLQIKLYFDGL